MHRGEHVGNGSRVYRCVLRSVRPHIEYWEHLSCNVDLVTSTVEATNEVWVDALVDKSLASGTMKVQCKAEPRRDPLLLSVDGQQEKKRHYTPCPQQTRTMQISSSIHP